MSDALSLSKEDLIKLGKGALIAGAGAILTYLTSNIANIDFGSLTPVIVAAFSILANFARKYIPDTTKETEESE